MNEVFEVGDKKYVLSGMFPVCVFVSKSRREAYLLELSSAKGKFRQFVYKSTGHNSHLPDEWLPFGGVHYLHLMKYYVNPDSLEIKPASSKFEHGRYGHPLYVLISKFLAEIPLNSSDFPEVNQECTSSISELLGSGMYDSVLEIQCRNPLRLVSFINEISR